MKTIAVVVVSLALTLMPDRAQAQVSQDGPVIVTRGSGTIKRAPDQAWVTIGAETRAATPSRPPATRCRPISSTRTAAGAGASVGPILRIEEISQMSAPVQYQAMRAMSAESAPTPISAGDLDIHAEVALTVSIR